MLYDVTYMQALKSKTDEQTKQNRKSHRRWEKTRGCERGAGGGRRATDEEDEDVQTSIRKRNVSQV